MSPPTLAGSCSRTASQNYLARCGRAPTAVCSVAWEGTPLQHHADSLVARRALPWLPMTFPSPYEARCPHSAMPSAIRRYRVLRSAPGAPLRGSVRARSRGEHPYPECTPEKQLRSLGQELAANRVREAIGLCVRAEVPDSSVP
ncbi:MAG: hypothetical protein VCF25_20795 [Candidatus Poribacteria bacterium]